MISSKILSVFGVISLFSPLVSSTLNHYSNSSSSIQPTITPRPVFCGGCALIYEVHASVWWPTIYTNYIATLVYTIDKDSGKTIGSKLTKPSNATAIQNLDYGVNFTSVYKLRDGGAVEYTYLNTLNNAPLATIIQYNEITMNHTNWGNGYALSTLYTNSSRTGPAATICTGTYYTINGTTNSNLPGLPSSTRYSYTTVVPFDSSYNMSKAVTYGLDTLASYVATYLNLTVTACSSAGGGVGTLKVGVTALTAIQTVFAQAQTSPTPSLPPPQTPTPPRPTPTPSSPSAPPVTPSPPPPADTPNSPSPSPLPPNQSSPLPKPPSQVSTIGQDRPLIPGFPNSPGSQIESSRSLTTTTILTTLTGPSGTKTTSVVATVVIGVSYTSTVQAALYTTVIPTTSTDAAGVKTTKAVATLVVGESFTSTLIAGSPIGASGVTIKLSPTSTSKPAEFTAGGGRTMMTELIWAGGLGMAGLVVNVLL